MNILRCVSGEEGRKYGYKNFICLAFQGEIRPPKTLQFRKRVNPRCFSRFCKLFYGQGFSARVRRHLLLPRKSSLSFSPWTFKIRIYFHLHTDHLLWEAAHFTRQSSTIVDVSLAHAWRRVFEWSLILENVYLKVSYPEHTVPHPLLHM